MRITQDVRKYAEEHGMASVEAIEAGMGEMAERFREQGNQVYLPVVSP